MMNLKIAFLHFAYCCGPQPDNARKILQGMEIAAQHGADWVLTPEMALQGYHMMRGDKPFQLTSLHNELLKPFQEACRCYGQRLFLGCGFVDDRTPRNSCVLISADGKYCNRHDKVKIVPWITENWAHPGEEFAVWDLDGINTSVMVCADAYFAEHGQLIAKTGAQLAVVVAAWPPGGHAGPPEEAWKQLSRQAQIPVIICNQTGTEGMDCSHAQSAAVSDGEVLFTYEGEEAVLLMDFDAEKKQVISQAFEVIDFAKCKEKNY